MSEFELIERLRDALPAVARSGDRVLVPIGDDAAVAQMTSGEHIVISTDTLNDGVHFRLDWTSWGDLGHKALAVNLSDLAAMGASPVLATVNLSLTGAERVSDLEDLYRGMGVLAARYRTVISGGDVTRSPGVFSITVTVVGETTGGAVMRRDAGQAGDHIWVTGTIGAAAAGLRLLEMSGGDPRRSATTAELLIEAVHRPEPRLAAGTALLEAGVKCAMDLSDGLAGDLHQVLTGSGVDAEIEFDHLPIAASVRAIFRDDATELAVRGGDDYELLFTAPPESTNGVERALKAAGIDGSIIGRLTERAGPAPALIGIALDGTQFPIRTRSYDHFAGMTRP